jgi:PAS domain S-box-containing protein
MSPILLQTRNATAQRAEDELRDHEMQLRLLTEVIPQHVWRALPNGHVDYCNQRLLDYTGRIMEEMAGSGFAVVIHPDDRNRLLETWRDSLTSGRPFEGEWRVRGADGCYRWFFTRGLPVRDPDGRIVNWYATNTDIEDRKATELSLRASEGRWKRVFENSAVGIALTDLKGHFELANAAYQKLLGYTEEELRKLSFLDVTVPEFAERNSALAKELLERKRQQFDIEKQYRRKDGSLVWVRNNVSLVPGADGAPRYLMAIVEDVSERKRAESALQESEKRFRQMADALPVVTWITALHPEKILYASPSFERVWGVPVEELYKNPNLWTDAIHSGDRERVASTYRRWIAGEKVNYHDVEYRMLQPSGAVRWIHERGVLSFNEEGKPYLASGISTDITERKLAEETLRQSEAYLAEAQRLSQTGSWAWNPKTGEIRYWSEECYRVLGFDPLGPPPAFETVFQRTHPDDQAATRQGFDEAIRKRTELELDYRLVHPGKGIRDIHAVGHPVLDAAGDLAEFVGTVIDVTERKRAEAELRQLVDFIPQLIVVLGGDGTWIHANRLTLEYTNLALDDFRLQDVFEKVIHPDDWEKMRTERKRGLSTAGPFETEARIRGKDGAYRWFLFRYNPLVEQGTIHRWYATATEIEARKQEEERVQKENLALREEIARVSMSEQIVGASPPLHAVLARVAKVAPTDSTVLILGETGTGKELVARAIHKRSPRAGRPFVSANCAAIPRDLIASELFGHEKGAFTGAIQRRLGRFELAEGGTIFLDEIGELPLETQIVLLRVLQEREFERVGGAGSIRTDVRVIAATNHDLHEAVASGAFRSDLFYRLNVVPIEMPPLRERKEDIPLLVEYFIDRYARKAGKRILGASKKSLELLQLYPWPGNIRELQNVVERSVILCETESFSVDESWLPRQPPASEPKSQAELSRKIAAQEKEMIEAALKECGGRVYGPAGAAAKLGTPRSTLESKIRSLKINKYRFKA